MNVLTPNETLRGAAEVKRKISHRLATLRAAHRLHDDHPDVTFSSMPDVLRSPLVDHDVFQAGWDIINHRYAGFGLHRLLPPERVSVGTHSLVPNPVFGAASTALGRATGTCIDGCRLWHIGTGSTYLVGGAGGLMRRGSAPCQLSGVRSSFK